MKFHLKYLKPKYLLFVIKLLYFKTIYRDSLQTAGIYYGFENDFSMRIEEGGSIRLDQAIYFSKRTDIMAIGGEITIGHHVSFNKDCTVVSRRSIRIGNHCHFGEGVSIYDNNHVLDDPDIPISQQGFSCSPIEIGNNVWVGGKVFIKSGVNIGDNVVIGANSVVTKDVPSGAVAFGNPATYRTGRKRV